MKVRFLRFLADADLNADIVEGVCRREPSVDFLTARKANLLSKPDPDVLELAANLGRLLVTHDRHSMPAHFRELLKTRHSPGILIIPQLARIRVIIDDLLLLWS